jgi:prepilin-type N-terminal cleavage/methylation domain-containing protein
MDKLLLLFTQTKGNKKQSKSWCRGFTLIELLVVIAIIGVLSSVVLASLNSARSKAVDASIKSNLKNAISQGEIFYNTNTIIPNSYTNICTNGDIGGAKGIGSFVLAAAKIRGLNDYIINGTGTAITATCNNTVSAWAAEVPLKILVTGIDGSINCSNVIWGDPTPGFYKHCDYYNSNSAWTLCASEDLICSYVGATQVRYGTNDIYFIKNIVPSMWCVDSTGQSKQSASIGNNTKCP